MGTEYLTEKFQKNSLLKLENWKSENERDRKHTSQKNQSGFGSSLATAFLCFLSLEIPIEPNRIPGRVLILTISLCGSLIFEAYNAGLISFLTTETYEFPIKNLEELAHDSEYMLLVEKGTANIDYFKSATIETNPAAAKIWSKSDQIQQITQPQYFL